jgi:uncharacterized protein
MRLTGHEVAAIKAAAAQTFGANAVVRLFGSRVDDARKGGDIDLHVEVDAIESEWKAKTAFHDALFRSIDEQRVDLVFSVRDRQPGPIERIAYRDGIVL